MPSEHQMLVFWLQVLALVASARGLGALARRIGQPPVVGELAAGLLLGPSVLGTLAPELQRWLFPDDPIQRSLLAGPAWLGVFLLLVLTGLETDLGLIRRLGRAALLVASGGLLIPVLTGVNVGFAVPDAFVGERATRAVFALFLGTAFGISALPVIAKILSDLDLMRRNVAQVLLAAAMADDVVGWVLLGFVSSLAQEGELGPGRLALRLSGAALFLAFAVAAGPRLVDAALRRVRARGGELTATLTVALLLAAASGALAQALGLEALVGAFVAGILIGRSRYGDGELFAHVDGLTRAFFAPLFFATAGLRVDLSHLAGGNALGWAALAIGAATASKFGGALLGGRLASLPWREAFALGAGLNARGAVQIAIAAVGISHGVLSPASYAVIVLMALTTSMMAPPLLRLALRGWAGTEDERQRLARERQLGANVLVRPTRVLLPSHGGPNSVLAARLIDLAWPEGAEVTVLAAGRDVPPDDVAKVRAALAKRPLVYEHQPGRAPLAAILAQAALGYGAIAVGATDRRIERALVSPVVDELLGASPLPVIMVRRGAATDPEAPPAFRRILVPASGTRTGRAAQELAYRLAARLDADVLIAHVLALPSAAQELAHARGAGGADPRAARAEVAERVVEEARGLAHEMGARAETVIRTGSSTPATLLAIARERAADLLVLAANVRELTGRPFLGHGVEYLLEQSPGTVIVVALPPGWGGGARGAR